MAGGHLHPHDCGVPRRPPCAIRVTHALPSQVPGLCSQDGKGKNNDSHGETMGAGGGQALSKDGVCPGSRSALKFPHQENEGRGLQTSEVQELDLPPSAPGGGGGRGSMVPRLQMRKPRLRGRWGAGGHGGGGSPSQDSVPTATALQIKKRVAEGVPPPGYRPLPPQNPLGDPGLALWAQEASGPHRASLSCAFSLEEHKGG